MLEVKKMQTYFGTDQERRAWESARRHSIRSWIYRQRGRPDPKGGALGLYAGRDGESEILTVRLRDRGEWPEAEQRAQSVNVNTAGGYTIQPGFERELEIALQLWSPLRRLATVRRVESGTDLPHPTVNDVNNVGIVVPENAQMTAATAVTFAQEIFHFVKYASGFLVLPVELRQDSGIDVDEWTGSLIGQRIARIQNPDLTTTLLQGVLNGANVSAVNHTSIVADDIYALRYSVDPAYRDPMNPSVGFMMHNTVAEYVAKLKDGIGRYLYEPAKRPGEPDMLIGSPVYYNRDMPSAIAANNITVLYGAFDKLHIRDVRDLRLDRLLERYAEFDQEGIGGMLRSDGILLDAGTHPIFGLLN